MFTLYDSNGHRALITLRTKGDIMRWLSNNLGIPKQDISVIRHYGGNYEISIDGYCYIAVKQPK